MVGFRPIFVFYYSQDICAQFELSKNVLHRLNRMSCFQKPNYLKILAKNQVKSDQEAP
jgi:hypothetical protein